MPPSLSPSAASLASSLLRERVSSRKVPPFWVSAVTAHGVIHSHAEGAGMDGDAVLRIFSMTKLITCLAVLQLIDRGDLTLETDVGEYFPALRKGHAKIFKGLDKQGEGILVAAKKPVLLKHLLNHSSGLVYAGGHPDFVKYLTREGIPLGRDALTDEAAMERYFTQPLLSEPGEKYEYSSSIDYAGRIVELITGQSLEEYFQEHFFIPLGMHSTSFNLTPALKARRSVPIYYRDPQGAVQPSIPEDVFWSKMAAVSSETPAFHSGGGGLFGTFNDYNLLLQHLLQIAPSSPIPPTIPALISPRSYATLFTPSLEESALEQLAKHKPYPIGREDVQWSTGLCINTKDWPGRRRAGSGYWSGAANSIFFIDPITGIAGTGGTQILPVDDPATDALWEEYQKIVYAGLESS